MKICHIITSLGNGGAEKNLSNICLEQSKKHRVLIILLNNHNFYKKKTKKKKY